MNQMDEERAVALHKELSELSDKQSEVLQMAAFVSLSNEEWAQVKMYCN